MAATLLARPVLAQTPHFLRDLHTDLDLATGSSPERFVSLGERVLFLAQTAGHLGKEVWSTDGSATGTERIVMPCPGGRAARVWSDFPIFPLGNGLAVLSAFCPDYTNSLWSTDGTSAGTIRLRVDRDGILLGEESAGTYRSQALNGRLLFATVQGLEQDIELWSTDGTREGTSPVAPLAPAVYVRFIVALDSFALIGLEADYLHIDLWRSDGTAAGTHRVGTFPIQPASAESLAIVGDRLLIGVHALPQSEVWVSDGVAAGTYRLASFNDSWPRFRVSDEEAYFVGTHFGQNAYWRTDGTLSGSFPLSAFDGPGDLLSYSGPEVEMVAGSYYFFGRAPDGAFSLWRNDGVPASPSRVADIAPPGQLLPEVLWIESVGDRIVFQGFDGTAWELFASDGTAEGTLRIADTCPGGCSGEIAEVFPTAESVYFTALDVDGHRQIWATHGTTESTRALSSALHYTTRRSNEADRDLQAAATSQGIVFRASDGVHGFEPWFVDPTSAGLVSDLLRDTPGIALTSAHSRGRNLAFAARRDFDGRSGVYFSDGTPTGTEEVAFANTCIDSGPLEVHATTAGVLFNSTEQCDSESLYSWIRSTREIVRLFTTPFPGWTGLDAVSFAGKVVVFHTPESATSIWRTNGTVAGTEILLPGVEGVAMHYVVQAADSLFVLKYESSGRSSFAVLDALANQLREIYVFRPGESYSWVVPVGTMIFFKTNPAGGPAVLWAWNASDEGATRLLEIPADEYTEPRFGNLGERAVFQLQTPAGLMLWVTDGTPEGTQSLVLLPESSPVGVFGRIGSSALFTVNGPPETPGQYVSQLWETDGSAEGTRFLRELSAGGSPAYIESATTFGEHLVFEGWSFSNYLHSVFLVDGATRSTSLLWVNNESHDGYYWSLTPTVFASHIFFIGSSPETGYELMVSDGTVAGTRLFTDLNPGPASSTPRDFTVAGDQLYFTADDGVHGRELWVLRATGGGSCEASATRLCLLGGRFSIELASEGQSAEARPISNATGGFARTEGGAPDAFVKLVDGNAVNRSQWLFAADLLTEGFELRVVDTVNGRERRWTSADSELASFADIEAFASFPSPLASLAPPAAFPSSSSGSGCVESAKRLCFAGGRVAVEALGVGFDGATLVARASALDLGFDQRGFWLFDPALLELVVRVEEPAPGRFALAVASLTNLGYAITATDLLTGAGAVIHSPAGTFHSQSVTDLFGGGV